MRRRIFTCLALLTMSSAGAIDFPDLGGLPDFSQPQTVRNTLFILTNPKSGSHLLLYSLMKITKRPLRGRLPLEYFYNDPACYPPENRMNYPLDFRKPTVYWGHEYHYLRSLNINNNKLIYILRNYKETIISNIMLNYNLRSIERDRDQIEIAFKNEIFNDGMVFKEYRYRLETYDTWNHANRCLVCFEDLVNNPDRFVPMVLNFTKDTDDYKNFILHYDDFKKELQESYDKKNNRTGSGSDLRYFSDRMRPETLKEVDHYVKNRYPTLWVKYLGKFAEE